MNATADQTIVSAEHYKEYLNLHGQMSGIKTRMDFLKEILVEDLKTGGKAQPKDLPFFCKLQPRTSAVADWKGAFLKYLLYTVRMKKKDAEEKIEETASNFEMRTSDALVVERNKEFTV